MKQTSHDIETQMPPTVRGPYIMTSSGRRFFLLDPRPEEVNLFDISHSLSQTCRWTGHTKRFLSVAEHCLLVSYLCPTLSALLHDAPEAYVGDNTRPLKVAVPQLKVVEEKIWQAIATKFRLPARLSAEVHEADQIALATEIAQGYVAEPVGFEWDRLPPPSEIQLFGLNPIQAENTFLARFKALRGEENEEST